MKCRLPLRLQRRFSIQFAEKAQSGKRKRETGREMAESTKKSDRQNNPAVEVTNAYDELHVNVRRRAWDDQAITAECRSAHVGDAGLAGSNWWRVTRRLLVTYAVMGTPLPLPHASSRFVRRVWQPRQREGEISINIVIGRTCLFVELKQSACLCLRFLTMCNK